METVRFGIIGCGGISPWHANAVKVHPNARLAAVSDLDAARAEAFARQFDVPLHTTADAILESPDIDAVCICTPSGMHASLALRALAGGKHVVVEKPLAITPESLDEVLEAERKYTFPGGPQLCAVSQMRSLPDVLRAREILQNNGIGDVTLADLSMKYYRDPSYYAQSSWRGTFAGDGGGALMNQGIHGADLLCFLCGDIKAVYARKKTLAHRIETEDTLCADFELKSGGLGVLTAATACYPGFKRRLEICGADGSLTLNEGKLASIEMRGKAVNEKADADTPAAKSSASDPFNMDMQPHAVQIGEFTDCILAEKPYANNAAEAARALKLIFAIYRSAECGTPVEVKEF
ncbi:oxidoreductase [Spirochaetia bacterium]|nr:oxidoreductase [Spirochaetia bacterium]